MEKSDTFPPCRPISGGDLVAAVLLSLALSVFFVATTDPISTPTAWDSGFYWDMALNGILDNTALMAPFAYRPVVPWAVGTVSRLTGAFVSDVFQWFTWISVFTLLVGVHLFFCRLGSTRRQATSGTVLLSLSFVLVRFPICYYALVDIEACIVLLAAVWLLFERKHLACLSLCSVGMLLKEFLILPVLLLSLDLCLDGSRRARTRVVGCLVPVLVVAGVALAARLVLDVSGSQQLIDPLNRSETSSKFLEYLLHPRRNGYALYSLCSVLLPVLLLMPGSWKSLRRVPTRVRVGCGVYLAALWGMSLVGGAGIGRFMAYAFPVGIFLLTPMLRSEPPRLVLGWVLLATALFNRIFWPVPDPVREGEAFLGFYGGHTEVPAGRMLARALEMSVLMATSFLLSAFGRGCLSRMRAK